MVKIRWIITDAISGVTLEEFNKEWNGLFGYFELKINKRVIGFYPNRELLSGEEGNEDICHWLYNLSVGIIQLKVEQEL